MSQVSKYPLSKDVYDRIFEIFLKTLINVRDKNEGKNLLKDFFTPTERVMFAKRLGIALLLERNYDYLTIRSVLKVSSGTIASVNLARKYGNQGYNRFIEKILRDEQVSGFLEELTLKLVSLPASGTKGSGAWKQAERELTKRINKRKSLLLR